MLITTQRTEPDWNNLEYGTLCNLGYNWRIGERESDSEPLSGSARIFKLVMRKHYGSKSERTHPILQPAIYANPLGRVTADVAVPAFFEAARLLRGEWLARMRAVLGNRPARVALQMEKDPIVRELKFLGVMSVKGKRLSPRLWPQTNVLASTTNDLTGQRFGRLVVLDRLPKQKWKCRCDCGRTNTVRSTHLRSGRTCSCGCLQAEHQERQQKRKEARRQAHG